MTRPTLLALFASILFVAACSSAANEAVPDGGTRNPDGGMPDGGAPDGGTPDGGTPLITAPCEVDGYPCSPAEQTEAALELSELYKAEIQSRRADGESYLDIAEWLRDQDGVVDVVAADDRLRFRVDGGSAHWFYDIGSEYPGIDLPSIEETLASESQPATTRQAKANDTFAPKRIIREDNSDTKIKKKGLILEPFLFQLPTAAQSWQARLEELHDYTAVHYLENNTIPDEFFANWDDYRFVWVLSHGAYLPDADDPEYTAIFSSVECGLSAWITKEIRAGRGEDLIMNGVPIASLDGLPVGLVEQQLKPDQLTRWRTFRDQEQRSLVARGKGCGSVGVPHVTLRVPDTAGNPIRRNDATLGYIYYDKSWFSTHYGGGVENIMVHLSVCSSLAVPLRGSQGSPTAIFGWTEPNNSVEDELAANALFERLFEHGEMMEDAFKEVQRARLDQHVFDGVSTELEYTSTNRGDKARIREIVTIIDKDTGDAFPDTGGFMDAREITVQGNTEFDVTVSIVGFGERDAKDFKVQIFEQSGQPLSTEHDVDDPVNGTTVMTIGAAVNQEIRTATDIELEARVKLPEESGNVYSKHPIEVTLFPAIEAAWTLNVGGGGTARGDFVFAPFPVAIDDGEGNLFWQVSLLQADDPPVPSATVLIRNHPGRSAECTGPLGNFDAVVTVQYTLSTMPTEGFGGGLDGGECGDFVNVEIVSFSREDDLVANVSGIICHWKRVGDDVVVTPVPINGRFQMPQAGCGMEPGGDLVGSYYASQAPTACLDVYPNAAIAPAWDDVCSAGGGIVCSDEPCSTAGQIGQCDYRSGAVSISFRGQIQHFLPGGDWPPVSDLRGACELQLGTWTTGAPPP